MVILEFDAMRILAVIAAVSAVVQLLKRLFEWLETWPGAPGWVQAILTWWAHGWGPRVLTLLVSLTAVLLPEIAADGRLTLPELSELLQALGIGGAATLLYWVTRWKWPWRKRQPQA